MSSCSVILPCYNVAQFLDRSIGSVLRQTRKAHEIIAADDGSTDDTVRRLEKFGPAVRVLRANRNEGPAQRRNDAISAATSDYIALLDPDDWWAENHLEIVAGLLDRFPEAGVAFSKVRLAGDIEGIWPSDTFCAGQPKDLLRIMMRNPVIQASSVVFRRSLFERMGPFVDYIEIRNGKKIYGWGGDYEWLLRAAALAPFVSSDMPTSYYYIRPNEAVVTPAKLIHIHRYRLMALGKLREGITDEKTWQDVLDRHQMAWEEDLERIWMRRELGGLRRMCHFGMSVPHLRRHTVHYLPRACFGWLRPAKRGDGPA